jgi:hypothetical protein
VRELLEVHRSLVGLASQSAFKKARRSREIREFIREQNMQAALAGEPEICAAMPKNCAAARHSID